MNGEEVLRGTTLVWC